MDTSAEQRSSDEVRLVCDLADKVAGKAVEHAADLAEVDGVFHESRANAVIALATSMLFGSVVMDENDPDRLVRGGALMREMECLLALAFAAAIETAPDAPAGSGGLQ